MYQWSSVSAHSLYSSFIGVSLNDFFVETEYPATLMSFTCLLSVTGIYIFSIGLFVALRNLKIGLNDSDWLHYRPVKIIVVYVALSVIFSFFEISIWNFPGIVQFLVFFMYIKWGFFMVMFISIFKNAPELKKFLFLIILVEFFLGLSSFFASKFANILYFTLIAYDGLNKKLVLSSRLLLVVIGILCINFAILWTASKREYREFLSQGTTLQAVTVSDDDANLKLFELVQGVDSAVYKSAIVDLVNRIGYIQFFASAIRMVPSKIPYENGKLYLSVIGHYITPRFLFPNKKKLDDSEHTNKYTGLGVSGADKGTSISLGSFADAYIDFGPVLMFIPIFFFGWLIGFYYKILHKKGIWSIIFTAPFFLLINIYGADTTKAFGFVTIYFVVIFLLNNLIMRNIEPIILKRKTRLK